MNLKGKVAIVTGASDGIGAAFSRALVSRGCLVYGLARGRAALDALRRKIGNNFVGVPCDVTVEAEVMGVFEVFRRMDILVNNAGIGRFGPVDSLSTDDWCAQMDTNLNGVFYCTRAVVPLMKKQNERTGFGGHIVNVASVAGHVGNPNLSAYNATKFGLRGFSDATMKELRSHGIKVSVLSPGSVATQFGKKAGSSGAPNPMRAKDIADTLIHVLEAPDNYLISEVVMRPLRPHG